MPSENSHSPTTPGLPARLALLQAANEGKLDGLRCPDCEADTVSVWFTHPAPDEYRTWFLCANCAFEMRAQNSGRPQHYCQERHRPARSRAKEPDLTAL